MSTLEEATRAFTEHLEGCEVCKQASSHRNACEEGVRLHEAMVVAAHPQEGG